METTLNIVVPIYGVSVQIGGSYSDFRKSLMQYASRVNYNLFIGRMRAQRGGLFIYPAEPADEDGNLLVRVEWHPALRACERTHRREL